MNSPDLPVLTGHKRTLPYHRKDRPHHCELVVSCPVCNGEHIHKWSELKSKGELSRRSSNCPRDRAYPDGYYIQEREEE